MGARFEAQGARGQAAETERWTGGSIERDVEERRDLSRGVPVGGEEFDEEPRLRVDAFPHPPRECGPPRGRFSLREHLAEGEGEPLDVVQRASKLLSIRRRGVEEPEVDRLSRGEVHAASREGDGVGIGTPPGADHQRSRPDSGETEAAVGRHLHPIEQEQVDDPFSVRRDRDSFLEQFHYSRRAGEARFRIVRDGIRTESTFDRTRGGEFDFDGRLSIGFEAHSSPARSRIRGIRERGEPIRQGRGAGGGLFDRGDDDVFREEAPLEGRGGGQVCPLHATVPIGAAARDDAAKRSIAHLGGRGGSAQMIGDQSEQLPVRFGSLPSRALLLRRSRAGSHQFHLHRGEGIAGAIVESEFQRAGSRVGRESAGAGREGRWGSEESPRGTGQIGARGAKGGRGDERCDARPRRCLGVGRCLGVKRGSHRPVLRAPIGGSRERHENRDEESEGTPHGPPPRGRGRFPS